LQLAEPATHASSLSIASSPNRSASAATGSSSSSTSRSRSMSRSARPKPSRRSSSVRQRLVGQRRNATTSTPDEPVRDRAQRRRRAPVLARQDSSPGRAGSRCSSQPRTPATISPGKPGALARARDRRRVSPAEQRVAKPANACVPTPRLGSDRDKEPVSPSSRRRPSRGRRRALDLVADAPVTAALARRLSRRGAPARRSASGATFARACAKSPRNAKSLRDAGSSLVPPRGFEPRFPP
jgi:hypothetical protein